MILNLFDKLVFATLLLVMFQVPVFSDHYLQFISGYYKATENMVEDYRTNARRHGYANVENMIDDFLVNSNPAVRSDAIQKQKILADYHSLKQDVATLKHGNFFEKAWFIAQPANWQRADKVRENFKPGIPLESSALAYSLLSALLLSAAITALARHLKKMLVSKVRNSRTTNSTQGQP